MRQKGKEGGHMEKGLLGCPLFPILRNLTYEATKQNASLNIIRLNEGKK
jgi:hypothetical protein